LGHKLTSLHKTLCGSGRKPRVVAITGAAQGIGRATAERLDATGWSIVGIDLQQIDTSRYGSAPDTAVDLYRRVLEVNLVAPLSMSLLSPACRASLIVRHTTPANTESLV